MAFVEHLPGFFADMAVEASVGGGTLRGMFDNDYAAGLGMGGSQPVFTCVASDAAAVTVGTALTIDGTGYLVAVREPDGTGLIRLVLEESA